MPDEAELKCHLLRGAPPVRSWSKYQKTIPGWTLCGVERCLDKFGQPRYAKRSTEDAAAVTCRYCKMLMATPAKTPARPSKLLKAKKASAK